MPGPGTTLGAVFVLLGLLFLALGLRLTRQRRAFVNDSRVVDADVVDLRFRFIGGAVAGPGSGVWSPVVRFVLDDGRCVEAETLVGSDPPPAQPGQRVQVRYDVADPTRVNLAHGIGSGAALGPIFGVVGGVVALAGLGVLGFSLLLGSLT